LCNAHPFTLQPVATGNTSQPKAEGDIGDFFKLQLLPAKKPEAGGIKVGRNNPDRGLWNLGSDKIMRCIIDRKNVYRLFFNRGISEKTQWG
jgi:hypothetical protein